MQFSTLHSPLDYHCHRCSHLLASSHTPIPLPQLDLPFIRQWRSDDADGCCCAAGCDDMTTKYQWLILNCLDIDSIYVVFECPDAVCWHSGWILMMLGLISYQFRVDCFMKSDDIDQNCIAYCMNESAILNTTTLMKARACKQYGCIMLSIIASHWRL